MKNNSIHFSIKYDGPALQSHQMDVRDLAPALLALSNLLEESNKIIYPDSNEVRVQIQGNFKAGSFGVDLVMLQDFAHQVIDLFAGKNGTAAANLATILDAIGLCSLGTGLIALLKFLKGRKPSSIKYSDDKVIFEIIENECIETMEVDLVTAKLFKTKVVRQSLTKVMKPLTLDGVDYFACGQHGKADSVVTKEEVDAFVFSDSDVNIVSDVVLEGVLLTIESAVFKKDNKWRFHDGALSFYAEIADVEFLSRTELGLERFGKNDVLIVDLRRVQSITDNGLKLDYIISKVREHKMPLQSNLLN